MTIFIGNLSWETEEKDLIDLFSTYGQVIRSAIPLDKVTKRKRGFGFVEMNSKKSEKIAIDDLQDIEWMGREIRVFKAEQRDSSGIKNKFRNKKKSN